MATLFHCKEILTAHETEMEELDSPTSAVALTFLGRKGAGGSGEESKALNTTQNSIFSVTLDTSMKPITSM